MRARYGNPDEVLSEIQGRYVSGRDKIVPPPKFSDVCRLLWPQKTAAHIASIAGRDERTAKRWLAGEFEFPIVVVLAAFQEMFRRE